MADWTKSMQQTYEFYIVNPNTWKDEKPFNHVVSCSIIRDRETDTLGSASLEVSQPIDECYIRIYLITIQNGVKERFPLGTYLVQTPSIKFNGKSSNISTDGYTPLIELKETPPPLGYYIPKHTNAMERVSSLTKENARAPVVEGKYPKTWYSSESGYAPNTNSLPASSWNKEEDKAAHIGDVFNEWIVNDDGSVSYLSYIWKYDTIDNQYYWRLSSLSYNEDETRLTGDYVADPEDTWFSYLSDLLKQINKKYTLDELGRISFSTTKDLEKMTPIWTYTDDNSSILQPDMTLNCDLFGIPNAIEVIYSNNSNNGVYASCVAENHDPNSPLSIEKRGRKIVHRVTDPGFIGTPTQKDAERQVKEYAKQLLKELSTIERTVTYTHGYCPVRLDDCVRLNYEKAGLKNIKARVVSQNIKCVPGCQVTEKAVYTTKLIDENYITGENETKWE